MALLSCASAGAIAAVDALLPGRSTNGSASCEELAAPLRDKVPIRSPLAVHNALLPFMRGKNIVEIGSRRGDDFCCYARVARSAVLFDVKASYCNAVTSRCARDAMRGGQNATHWASRTGASNHTVAAPPGNWVICSDYLKATVVIDADLYIWWVYPSDTFNPSALRWLKGHVDAGNIRRSAQAVLMSDLQVLSIKGNPHHEDDLSRYLRCASWSADVSFDESSQDCMQADKRSTPGCLHTRGVFRVLVVPLIALSAGHGHGGGAAPTGTVLGCT